MSTLAKIFVVINLFLAVAFVGVSAALLGERDSWKVRYENEADRLEHAVSAMTAKIQILETQKNDEVRKYRDLYDRDQEVLREWERSRERVKDLQKDKGDLQAQVSGLQTRLDNIDEAIQEVSRENTRLSDLARRLESERNDARGAQREAEELYYQILGELEIAEDGLRQKGKALTQTRDKLTSTELERDYARRHPGDPTQLTAPPPIDGRIVAVSSEVPLVMMNVGLDDRVEKGHVFTVYRGAIYVSRVQVQDVFKDSCSAIIMPAYQKLQPREGDDVSTRIH